MVAILVCRRCHVAKAASDFHNPRTRECKPCTRAYWRESKRKSKIRTKTRSFKHLQRVMNTRSRTSIRSTPQENLVIAKPAAGRLMMISESGGDLKESTKRIECRIEFRIEEGLDDSNPLDHTFQAWLQEQTNDLDLTFQSWLGTRDPELLKFSVLQEVKPPTIRTACDYVPVPGTLFLDMCRYP